MIGLIFLFTINAWASDIENKFYLENQKLYVENERDEDLKMMEGTNCIIENDFTSAIYKTIWSTLES